jgi:hypothetical protein
VIHAEVPANLADTLNQPVDHFPQRAGIALAGLNFLV